MSDNKSSMDAEDVQFVRLAPKMKCGPDDYVTVKLEAAKTLLAQEGTFFSVYGADDVTNFFVDFDVTLPQAENELDLIGDKVLRQKCRRAAIDAFVLILKSIVSSRVGTPLEELPPEIFDVRCTDDCRWIAKDGIEQQKISFHLTAPWVKCSPRFIGAAFSVLRTLLPDDNEDMRLKFFGFEFPWGMDDADAYLDRSVYPTGDSDEDYSHKMRCVNQKKGSLESPMVPIDPELPIEEYMLEYVAPNAIDVSFSPEELKKYVTHSKTVAKKDAAALELSDDMNIEQFVQLVHFIPSSDLDAEHQWFAAACAVFACSRKLGMSREDAIQLFDQVSQKSYKYDAKTPKRIANIYGRVRPDRTGFGKLFALAAKTPHGKAFIAEIRKEPCLFTDEAFCIAQERYLKSFDDPRCTVAQRNKAVKNFPLNARKSPYDVVKREFERMVVFNQRLGKYIVTQSDGSLEFFGHLAMKNAYDHIRFRGVDPKTGQPCTNSFMPVWMVDPAKRIIQNVDFLPPPLEVHEGTFNTYRGMRIKALRPTPIRDTPRYHNDPLFRARCDRSIEMMLLHLFLLAGKEKKAADYLLAIIADVYQNPGVKRPRAPVFRSAPGCGKARLHKLQLAIAGETLVLFVNNLKQLTGQFNGSSLESKLFIFCDEVSFDLHAKEENQLKSLISDDTVHVERKGVDAYSISNFARFFFFSNDDIPVKIADGSDRRYFAMECSDEKRNDPAFFKEIEEIYGDLDMVRHIYDYFMAVDLSGIDFYSPQAIPITRARREIIAASMPRTKRWLGQYLKFHFESLNTTEARGVMIKTATELYNACFDDNMCKLIGMDRPNTMETITEWGTYMTKNITGVTKKKSNGLIKYFIDAAQVFAHLAEHDDDFADIVFDFASG